MASRKAFLSRNIEDSVIFNPLHDDVLTYYAVSGVWINKPASTLFADLYLTGQESDIEGYHKLLVDPPGDAEIEDQVNVATASGLMLIRAFATDDAVNHTLLRGGSWHFVTWAKVDNTGGNTDIVVKVYTRTTGDSETLIATIVEPIDSTILSEIEVDVFVPDTVVNEDDRIVVKYYAQTTSNPTRVVTMTHDGVEHYTHLHLPFGIGSPGGVTDHGALTGLADDDHEQYLLADGSRICSGDFTVGAGDAAYSIVIDGAATFGRLLVFRTNGVDRWRISAEGTAEGGANAGSDFEILSRQDDGSALHTALKIIRSTGEATFSKNLIVGDGTGAKILNIDGAAGEKRDIEFKSGGSSRWILRVNATAESGGDVGSDFQIISKHDDGTYFQTPIKIVRSTGDVIVNTQFQSVGDIYTEPWTDYSGDTSITGWSSFTAKVLNYKKVGKLVFVDYRFSGPGNSTTVQFTLPDDCVAGARHVHAIGRARDNNAWLSGVSYGRTTGGNAIISLIKTQSGGTTGTWSALTGTRTIEGSFWYEAA